MFIFREITDTATHVRQHYMHLAIDIILNGSYSGSIFLAFVLYSAEDLNPYRLSCSGS